MKFPAVKWCQSNLRCLSLATSAPRAAFELAQGVNEAHVNFLLGVRHTARMTAAYCYVPPPAPAPAIATVIQLLPIESSLRHELY